MAGVDLQLNPRGDEEGWYRHEKADAHFAQGCEREHFVQARINQPCEDRDEHHDHDRVDGIDLRREPFDAQPIAVHAVGLEHPLGAGLVKERPEHRHKQVDDAQAANDLEAFFAEGFPQEIHAAGRDMHEFAPPHPKHNGGQQHQPARHAEGNVRPEAVEQDRRHDLRGKRAKVDGEIKPPKNLGEQMPVGFAELIPHMRRDTRFDTARANGD